ncbi:MAG: substrate-binding domain-containing protein [Clostridium sp.]|nr:substrate-binding domain-containing protein [Clostridium sp.]
MSKKITMEFIADKLGITKNTVSLAIRNMPGVSDKTRQAVLDAAKKYGYVYKKSSAGNASRADNICLMISDEARNSVGFFSFIQYGIESEAKKNNLSTILCSFDNDLEFSTPPCIKDGIVSGIITLGPISKNTVNSILDLDLPLVIIDDFFDDIEASYILTDNLSGGYIATEYLIKSGHGKIGFSGDIFASPSFCDRYMGYLKALSLYGLPFNESSCITDVRISTLFNESLDKAVERLKKVSKLPTAYFCCNDIEAICLYKALSAMNICVPEDISLVGFDDIESSKDISPELTTMHIYKEAMGERAVKKLIDKIEGEKHIEEKILLPTVLIKRQSVMRLK